MLSTNTGFNNYQANKGEGSTGVYNDTLCTNPHVIQIHIINEVDPGTGEVYPKIHPIEGATHLTEAQTQVTEDEIQPSIYGMYSIVAEMCAGQGRREIHIKIDVSSDRLPAIFSMPFETTYRDEGEEMAQGHTPALPKITPIDYKALREQTFEESCINTDVTEHFPTKELQTCITHALNNGLKPICKHEEELKHALAYYEKNEPLADTVTAVREQLHLNDQHKYSMVSDIYEIANVFDQKCKEATDGIQHDEANRNTNGNSPWNQYDIELASYKPGEHRLQRQFENDGVTVISQTCNFKTFVKTQALSICSKMESIFSELENSVIHSQ